MVRLNSDSIPSRLLVFLVLLPKRLDFIWFSQRKRAIVRAWRNRDPFNATIRLETRWLWRTAFTVQYSARTLRDWLNFSRCTVFPRCAVLSLNDPYSFCFCFFMRILPLQPLMDVFVCLQRSTEVLVLVETDQRWRISRLRTECDRMLPRSCRLDSLNKGQPVPAFVRRNRE